MESLLYEKKVKDMQKYIPFLENLITKLEKSQDGQSKSRESQLAKMRMLYELLTKRDKKLKLDTLVKCESVLAKLYKKVEQNINENESKIDKSNHKSEKTEKFKDRLETAELSAPASPQNSDNTVEFHAPIVIPTERTNSPNYGTSHRYRDKDTFDSNRNKDKYDRHGNKISDSKTELYRRRSPSRYDNPPGRYDNNNKSNNRYSDKSSSSYDKFDNRKDRHYDESRHNTARSHERNNKYYERRPYSNSPNNEMWKSHENRTAQSTSNNNSNTNNNNSNSSSSTRSNTNISTSKATATPSLPSPTSETQSKNRDTIFLRLGEKLDVANLNNYENFQIKIKNDKLKKKRAPTPLSEVLNSPPLSANDIDDLLNESGEKVEGRRKEEKHEKHENQELSELEAVRKKLNNEIGICKKKAKEFFLMKEPPSDATGGSSSPSSSSSLCTKTKSQSLSSKTQPEEKDQQKDNRSTLKVSRFSPLIVTDTHTEKRSSDAERSVTEPTEIIKKIKSPTRDKNLSQTEKTMEKTPQELPEIQSPTPSNEDADHSNIRLAYKYNPHPRRSIDSLPKSEESSINSVGKSVQNLAKPVDPRVNRSTINTIPMSVNFADPRLRNRPLLPVPPPNLMDVNIPKPAFSTLEVRRPSVGPMFSIFGGNYQQSAPQPVAPPVQIPNQLIHSGNPPQNIGANSISSQMSPVASMSRSIKPQQPVQPPSLLSINVPKPLEPVPSNLNYNKFQPMLNDQVERMKYLESKKYRFEPKTYGEYRQAKMAEKKHKEPYSSPKPRRESIDNTPPSCLDKLYRKSDFKSDVPSVSNFKIPKVSKPKSEESGKDKSSDIYLVSSDEETSNVKETTKKSSKQLEEKKEKSKSHSGSSSDKEKSITGKTEEKKDKSKNDKQKTEQKTNKDSSSQKSNKSKTTGKDKDSAEEKSIKTEEQKKINKQPKNDNLDEKQENKKRNESAKQKKSSSDTVIMPEETKQAEIVETSKNDIKEQQTRDDDANDDSKKLTKEKETEDIKILTDDEEKIPIKSQPRRRKSVVDTTTIPIITDGSEISTQNIITGKRRTRCVIPPTTPTETKQSSTSERKAAAPSHKRKPKSEIVIISESESESHNDEQETKTNLSDLKNEKSAAKKEEEDEEKETETKLKKLLKIESKQDLENICAVSSTTSGCSEEPHSSIADAIDVKKEEVKSDVTKEWLEGFLLNIFNPSLMNKDSVLNMLEKVLDDKKFKQIKAIMDENQEDKTEIIIPDNVVVAEEEQEGEEKEEHQQIQQPEPIETLSENKIEMDSKELKPTTEQKKKPKHKTELDRLNEDIRDMFISQGVLTATGRRMCTVINEEKKVDEKPKPPSKQIQKNVISPEKKIKVKQPKIGGNGKASVKRLGGKKDVRGKRKGSFKKKRVLPKRGAKLKTQFLQNENSNEIMNETESEQNDIDLSMTYESESFNSEIDDAMPILEAQTIIKTPDKDRRGDPETLEEISSIPNDMKIKKKYKPCPKSKRKIQIDSDESSNSYDEDIYLAAAAEDPPQITIIEKSEDQAEIIIGEDESPNFLSAILEESNSIQCPNEQFLNSKAGQKGRRGRKKSSWGDIMDTEINISFKNTNPDMHVKSEYVDKCILCGFVGKRMCNHYVHAHPDSEVPISRLPQNVLDVLKMSENKALFTYKKVDCNTVYYHKCPFCDIRSSYTRRGWMDHFGTHTGEYAFKCSECSRYMNLKQMIQKHIKHSCPNGRIINLRGIDKEKKRVVAHVCNLCNYLQMNRYTVMKHLIDQHDENNELITTITLISCENVLRADETKRAAIIEEYEKSMKTGLNFGDDSFMTGSSKRSLSFISDELSERLRDTDDDVNLDMFEHSIFNDMSLVDRLSERLNADLDKQINSSNPVEQTLDASNKSITIPPSPLNMTTNAEINQASDNSMSETTIYQNPNTSENDGLLNEQNNSSSMANRLSERFNSQNNSPSKQQENDSSGSLSMAERLCQRFSTNSEEEKQTDLSDNTPQAIVYVVDKIDEHNIANAGHVKANEIKLPRNEKENTLSFSDILNQRLKDNETALPSSPVSATDKMPPVFENDTNNHPSTSENVFKEFRGESTTSLVERIKLRLNNGKNDTSTTTTNQTSICPGSAELSIVDRLSERLQNTTSGLISPQKNSSQQNHSTPKSRMSIVERLSQRLKSTTQDVSPDLTMTLSEEDLKLPETSKSSSEINKSRISKSSSNEVDSSYEGELIIDEETAAEISKEVAMKKISNDTTKHTKDSDLTETITISSSQDEEDDSEITEICDNDDDWVDIETSPTEKPIVRDLPKRQDKTKKNKLTFETFSRLYAFNSKGRTGASKKEKNNKKVVKLNESCTLNNNTEVVAKSSEDKLMEINGEKGDIRISSSSSPSPSTRISTAEKDVPKSMDIDPLQLPTEALSQLNVNHSIPWSSAEITKNIATTGRATKHNEIEDPLELPLGTEGQFICLTSSITTLPSTNCLSTVMSGINPTISTISTSSPLCRDLGDISGLLGLNTNQLEINPVSNQTTTDPLAVNDLNSTLFVLSEQTSMQSNLVPILDVGNNQKTNKSGSSEISNSIDAVATIDIGNIQGTSKPGTSEILNPVDAVATEEKTRGFGIIESNSADCHNITGTNGVNSVENNGDSCSNGVTLGDPSVLNTPLIHRIDKLGYSKSMENLIKYHCLVDSCSFLYSELPIGLQNHFITEHADILWEGYCYSCEANVCNDEAMSLSREFKHMLEVHVKSLNDKVKISEINVKPPLIKFRRLSGDMLSVNQVPQEQSFLSSHEPVLLENDLTKQSSDEIGKDDQFSNGNQYQPKIHNKTTEPEKIFPLLKVTTKTSIINVPTKTASNPVDQKSMLDAYLVRNTVPKMSDLVIAKVEEAVKDTTIIVNNPSSSSSSMSSASDLKISSVAQNVNQDLIQQQNSASEPFFKIKEVISLSTSKPTLTSSTPTTTMSCGKSLILSSTSKSPATFTQTIATKPNVLQIQSATASSSPSSSSSPSTITSRHSALLKPVKKSTNPIPTMSNLKIQSVTSMAPSINNDQLAAPSSSSSSEVCQIKDKTSGDGVLSVQQGNISTNILKPWIYSKSFKSKPIVEKLLQEISLYCLFKCMSYDCAFTTNSSLIMLQHLDNHEDLAKKDNDPAAANAQNLGECPYCTDSHVKNKALLTHIVQTHGKDIYQCPYCFYRSSVDHNVMIHMNAFHKGREKSILLCFGEQRRLATEIRNLANFRSINVRPIKCLDCSKGFYIVRNYVKHIKEHSPQYNSYKCSLCYAFVSKNLSEKHLLSRHNIAVYECIYCIFATEQMDTMRTHVANRHSSCLSYMCVRLSPNKNFDSTDETLELSTVLANLAESVDEKYLRRCPYTPIQLNSVNATSAIECNNKEKAISSHSPQSSLIMNQKYKNLEIASVQSISNEVFDNLHDRPKMLPPEATNNKEVRPLSQLSSSISSPSYSTMHLPSTSSSIIMPPPSSTIMPPPYSKIMPPPPSSTIMSPSSSTIMPPPSSTIMPIPSSSLPSSNFQSTNELQLSFDSDIVNRERAYIRILEAAREMVESTGLQGPELYKCAQCEQPSQIDTAMNFHLHLQGHISLGTTEIKCFHCAYSTKNLIALKNHLRIHSGHRYFCYFCNYTGSTAKMLIKHISDSHSKTGMILYPLIYGQTNKNKDFFVICPKNITPNELIQFGERMVRAWERKKALTKKYFTPDEIELLPRQAIFFNEVHCKVCDYRTKVRTNMFRHLQFHKQEVKVATVDPVNPVPCLNSNEKHFDKMLNLACSSNVNRSGTAATKEEPKVPEFIPHMKRYVCGVPGCTYLTISENMMKWHLSALHSNEKIFICSHCSLEVCKKNICGEKILDHLKYHDSKLFICGECNYMHYQKPVVEQHINEKHPTGPCSIISYERDGTDTIKSTDPILGRKTLPVNTTTTSPTTGKDEEMKWECGLCKARGPTYNQMVSHMNRTHDVKNRYQCVYCNFGGAQVSNIVVHVAEKHPTKVKEARCMFYKLNENPSEQKMLSDTTPIWTRDPARVKNIRGILMEDEEESQRNLLLDENYEDENEEEEQQQIITNNSEISSSRSGSGITSSTISKDPTVYVPHSGINTTMPKENATNLNTTTKIPKTYGSAPKKRDEIKSCTQCLYTSKISAEFQSHIKTFDHKALSVEMEQYVFFCFHCTGAYKTNTIQNLKRHWTMKHEIVKNHSNNDLVLNEVPFWYQLFPKVACGRCSYKNEIQSAVKHHQSFHFGTPLALVNSNNSKLCSQCPYEYRNLEDLGEHFSTQHPKITTPALTLTNDLLDKFLKVGHRQRLIKCLKCNYVGGTVGNESFMVHHNKLHPNTSPLYDYIQDEILYLCTQCMFVSNDEEKTLRHMYEHPFNCTYKCTCNSKHKLFSEFAEHLDKVHKSKPNEFTVGKCIESKVRQLKDIRIILPNGLIFDKNQLNGTKYGDSSKIENIAKEEFSKYLSVTTASSNVEKPNTPANVSDSENESLSSSTSDTKRSSRARKRRRHHGSMGRNVDCIDKYGDEDNWTPHSKNKRSRSNASSKRSQSTSSKRSQNPPKNDRAAITPDTTTTTTTTNRKLEKVDLSKIFTTMTIAGSDVSISCDRFAKLVKIHTFVKVDRIDISKYLTKANAICIKRKPKKLKNESNKKLKTS